MTNLARFLIAMEIVAEHTGKYDTLLEVAKRRNVRWFGHVVRAKGIMANTILQDNVEGEDHEEGQWLDDKRMDRAQKRYGENQSTVWPAENLSVTLS